MQTYEANKAEREFFYGSVVYNIDIFRTDVRDVSLVDLSAKLRLSEAYGRGWDGITFQPWSANCWRKIIHKIHRLNG